MVCSYWQLDNIMENEVYRVAVQLLERFDPNNPALKMAQEPTREDVRQRRGQKRDLGVWCATCVVWCATCVVCYVYM